MSIGLAADRDVDGRLGARPVARRVRLDPGQSTTVYRLECATHRPMNRSSTAPGSRRTRPPRVAHRDCIYVHFRPQARAHRGDELRGEIKKSIFTILKTHAPIKGVLSMHCSANVGRDGDSALFFRPLRDRKTTLSSDPERGLIGDGTSTAGASSGSSTSRAAATRVISCRRRPSRRSGTLARFGPHPRETSCSIPTRATWISTT